MHFWMVFSQYLDDRLNNVDLTWAEVRQKRYKADFFIINFQLGVARLAWWQGGNGGQPFSPTPQRDEKKFRKFSTRLDWEDGWYLYLQDANDFPHRMKLFSKVLNFMLNLIFRRIGPSRHFSKNFFGLPIT